MKTQTAVRSLIAVLTLVTSLTLMDLSGAWAQGAPPAAPTDPAHPGSLTGTFGVRKESFKVGDRSVDVFLPQSGPRPYPVVVFGHGQALDLKNYVLSFEHFARKGIAVIYPQYDTGFWDQSWRRMADDYNLLVQSTLQKYPEMDRNRLIYSGHSKGGYIGLMAAGAPSARNAPPSNVVVFNPAGYDRDYLKSMNSQLPLTVVWSDQDTIISRSSVEEIYNQSPSARKQYIEARSYRNTNPSLKADHFFVLTAGGFFGGSNGTNALHYFGFWKWLGGAALNPIYLEGTEAASTGMAGFEHLIIRSF